MQRYAYRVLRAASHLLLTLVLPLRDVKALLMLNGCAAEEQRNHHSVSPLDVGAWQFC